MTENNQFDQHRADNDDVRATFDDVRTNLDDAADAAEERIISSESPYGSQPGGEHVSFAEATDGVSATPASDDAHHLLGGDRSLFTNERVHAMGDKVKENLAAIDKMSAKEFGDLALKFASDTAYAAAGLANLVAEKAREMAEKQREATDRQRAAFAEAPKSDDPTKDFLDQVTAQVNRFVEDLGHTYKDLADRGRDTVAKMQAQQTQKAEAPKGDDAPGPFDLDEDADLDHTERATVIKTEGQHDVTRENVDAPTTDWGTDNR